MECCQTTRYPAYCMSCVARFDPDRGPRTKAAGDFLKYMVSPENSNREDAQPGTTRAAWMGAVKTLFWIGMAMAIGVVLATLCK